MKCRKWIPNKWGFCEKETPSPLDLYCKKHKGPTASDRKVQKKKRDKLPWYLRDHSPKRENDFIDYGISVSAYVKGEYKELQNPCEIIPERILDARTKNNSIITEDDEEECE
jgi:hypothetical protein